MKERKKRKERRGEGMKERRGEEGEEGRREGRGRGAEGGRREKEKIQRTRSYVVERVYE